MSRYYNTALKYKAFAQTEIITKSGVTPVPIATSYAFDLLYNFNDTDGIIKTGQTIFEVGY